MQKIYTLTDSQLDGISKIRNWLVGHNPDDELRIMGRIKSTHQLFVMVEKIINLRQYTIDEQTLLNELRSICIGKREVEYV
jgi:hypothetical protein